MDEAVDVDGAPIIAGCEAAELFEAAEASFDLVMMPVDVGIVGDGDLAVALDGITASASMAAVRSRKSLPS